MKKFYTLCLCLLLSSIAFADNVIKLNDETLIEDFTSISFDASGEGNVLIYFADDSSVTVNMNLMRVLPNAISGIQKMESATIARVSKIVGDRLEVDGAKAGEVIRVYDTAGTLAAEVKASSAKVSIDLSHCNKGVYILSIGKKVIKFTKQ